MVSVILAKGDEEFACGVIERHKDGGCGHAAGQSEPQAGKKPCGPKYYRWQPRQRLLSKTRRDRRESCC